VLYKTIEKKYLFITAKFLDIAWCRAQKHFFAIWEGGRQAKQQYRLVGFKKRASSQKIYKIEI